MPQRLLVLPLTMLALLALGAASVFAAARLQPGPVAGPGVAAPGAGFPAGPGDVEPGLVVVHVAPGSPAAQADIRRGTILLSVDGHALATPLDLERVVAAHAPGDQIRLQMTNCATPGEIAVTLAAQPMAPEANAPPAGFGGWLGAVVAPPVVNSPGQAPPGPAVGGGLPAPGAVQFFNESGAAQGIGVIGVAADSAAAHAGLQPGDVISAVDGADAHGLFARLDQAQLGETVTLTVYRGGSEHTLSVTLDARDDGSGRASLGVYAWSHVMPALPPDMLR